MQQSMPNKKSMTEPQCSAVNRNKNISANR